MKRRLMAALLLWPALARATADQTFVPAAARWQLAVLQEQAAALAKTVVTEADNSKTLELKAGSRLEIRLSAQLGTGYGWDLAWADADVLEPLPGYPKLEANRGMPGGADTQVFAFTVKAAGKGDVALYYQRPWDRKASKTFTVTVVAR